MTTRSEALALELIDTLNTTRSTEIMSSEISWSVGRSYTPRIIKILKGWDAITEKQTGVYAVNYAAPIFS